jgi:hypothetical protein
MARKEEFSPGKMKIIKFSIVGKSRARAEKTAEKGEKWEASIERSKMSLVKNR